MKNKDNNTVHTGKEAIRERRKIKIKSFTKNKLAVFGLVLTIFIVLIGIFANVICYGCYKKIHGTMQSVYIWNR